MVQWGHETGDDRMDAKRFAFNQNNTPYSFEELYRLALDHYPGSVIIIDKQANILYANETSGNMLGVPRKWLLSTNMYTITQMGLAGQSCGVAALEGERPVMLYSYNKKNEGMFLSSVPVRGEGGEVTAVFTYSQDEKYLSKYVDWMKTEKTRIFSALQFISDRASANVDVIAQSKNMQTLFELATQVAPSSGTISLYGESGVGKEVIARYIHSHSRRRDQMFLPVNCAAIPIELAESEFFGYERGAFTGARQNGKLGFFELANGGTLFLDEIGELPLAIQAKLLRVIESSQLTRIGGNKVIDVDARILCATNRDLKKMVAEGTFREDLFYRLDVIPLHIPPLRERQEDIVPLAEKFLAEYNRKNNMKRTFSPEILSSFKQYDWPGNVRELRNMVERLVITSECDIIYSDGIWPLLPAPSATAGSVQPKEEAIRPLKLAMQEMERQYIKRALIEHQWNVRKTAAVLAVHPSGLYKKIEEYGISK